jgi:hypothetical protein
MAVRFETPDPEALLNRLRKAINDGVIETWTYDKDGDFTHTAKEWNKQAWLRPRIEPERLSFYIIPRKGVNISRVLYAVYHGRLIETALSHCDDAFKRAYATAYPEKPDNVKGST